MTKIRLNIKGMSCTGCVNSVSQAISAIDKVDTVTVDLEKSMANITSESDILTPQALINAVKEAGYEAEEV